MNGKVMDQWKPGVSMFAHMQFSFLTNAEESGNDWYNFQNIEKIPRSIKYDFDHKELDFVRAPGHRKYKELQVNLWEALQFMDQDDRFFLNPVRWDKVGRDLSEGWCYIPWLSFDKERCKPKLTDGRHRIVAMMKFSQHKKIPFVVSQDDYSLVEDYLNKRKAT